MKILKDKTMLDRVSKFLMPVFFISLCGTPFWMQYDRIMYIVSLSIAFTSFLLLKLIAKIQEEPYETVAGRQGRKKAEALDVDFVDVSVLYKFQRLGEDTLIKFPTVGKKGYFVISGDYMTVDNITFNKENIQWLQLYKNSTAVRLDVTIDGYWYQISIDPGYGGMLDEFLKRVPKKLKHRRSANRPNIRTGRGKEAHITTQNLQGIFEKHEAVELYVTPLWMVVLHNGRVFQQHFIDRIADIRFTRHPTDLDDEMQLLTFEVGEEAFAYALKDKNFVTRLSDATKDSVDSELMRKKKKQS